MFIKIEKSPELKLTEYLSVKLERNITMIYVNGIPFNQCKYLLLTLEDKDDWDIQGKINSINEEIKLYGILYLKEMLSLNFTQTIQQEM